MDGDVRVAVTGQTMRMLDPDAAEPELLACLQAVNIIAGAHTNGRGGACEIGCVSKLVQGFVSFDEHNLKPGGLGHLGIVSGRCRSFPGAMGGENLGKAESLGSLHPS